MTKRPYFRYNITELEKLFEASKDDSKILETLHNELQFRNSDRAKTLRWNVERQLRDKTLVSVESEAAKSKTMSETTRTNSTTLVTGTQRQESTNGSGKTSTDHPTQSGVVGNTPSTQQTNTVSGGGKNVRPSEEERHSRNEN